MKDLLAVLTIRICFHFNATFGFLFLAEDSLILWNGYVDFLSEFETIFRCMCTWNLMVSVDWLENPTRKIILVSQVIFLLERTLFEEFSPQLVSPDVSRALVCILLALLNVYSLFIHVP